MRDMTPKQAFALLEKIVHPIETDKPIDKLHPGMVKMLAVNKLRFAVKTAKVESKRLRALGFDVRTPSSSPFKELFA